MGRNLGGGGLAYTCIYMCIDNMYIHIHTDTFAIWNTSSNIELYVHIT